MLKNKDFFIIGQYKHYHNETGNTERSRCNMYKQQVVAYCVMESTMDPVKPINLQVFDRNNSFFLRFQTCLQEFNILNRNRRKYILEPMMESLQAPHISELMLKRSWAGEAGHPDTDEVKRILTINPKLTSHIINSFSLNGIKLMGEIETLDDGMYGTQMTKNILQGLEPAFSLRALAQLAKQGDGSQIMRSRAHIVTYDRVILPSHNGAYRDMTKPIEKIIKNLGTVGNTITENLTVAVKESQLIDFIKMESTNVKLISNVCEVSMESMQLSKDFKHVILKENGNTFFVNIDDKIKRDINMFMSHL